MKEMVKGAPVVVPTMQGPDSLQDTIARIRAEYVEMPGLQLTFDQARRFLGLDPPACREALNTLVDARFLSVRSDGRYTRFSGDDPFHPRTPKPTLQSAA